MININIDRPFAVYIHIPFCIRKCKYCDFYSEKYKRQGLEDYLQSLKREIGIYSRKLVSKRVRTIYLGGGTPSLLRPADVEGILYQLQREFDLSHTEEITMEANPSSLNSEKLSAYREIGINRLSVGIQSFSDRELDFLGRLHSAGEAVRTIGEIKEVFSNYNLDLIFAIPGQNLESLASSLEQLSEFKPPHISLYNLQIESGTPLGDMLARGEVSQIGEELDASMYEKARNYLTDLGYRQYEISNFAFPGYSSVHNKIYWQYRPYLGLGPAAHGFTGQMRYYNVSSLREYNSLLAGDRLPVSGKIDLSQKELMSEMMFMGLRLTAGINRDVFQERFKKDIYEVYGEEINRLKERKLLEEEDKYLALTDRGRLLGNRVFAEFLPD